MNAKVKAALASYARSVLSAVVALYLAGVTDPVQLLSALAAGLLPVAIRYINPKDPAFGRVAEQVVLARLPKNEAVIPRQYLEKNKEAIDKLVNAVAAEAKRKAATSPKKTTAPKTVDKKTPPQK
jgi:hypothetical protein